LLSKWLFRLLNSESTWQTILRRKYLRNKTLIQVEYVSRNSHFWAGLMNIKRTFLNFDSLVIGDGSQLRFWEDSWYGQHSFKDRFPNLYGIVRRKNVTLRSVLSTIPLNVEFRRTIAGAHLMIGYRL
jgi:hypothetical protein